VRNRCIYFHSVGEKVDMVRVLFLKELSAQVDGVVAN